MREQVVSFPPQPVITSDNLVVSIDTVLYFKVVDPVGATYEIANFLQAIEQLTVTTLRNVIGSLDLEKALTSREEINRHLSIVLDETTGRWGVKVTRVEIKAIEPPPSIRDSMGSRCPPGGPPSRHPERPGDKQCRSAPRKARAAAVLRADGERQARILQAEGQAKAISTVFSAIHAANPDSKVMAYQYLQALPQIAAGASNKIWIIPAELTKALEGISGAFGGLTLGGPDGAEALPEEAAAAIGEQAAADAHAAAQKAAETAAEVAAAVAAETGETPELPAAPGTRAADVLGEADREKG
jgi:hypothetical protein